MRACGRCLDREDSNVHLTEMRSVSLISCLPKMWPSSSTSTGSQIATWRRSLAWTRREFSHYLRSLLTEKMFVWPPASLTELGSARYSSAPSITTVWWSDLTIRLHITTLWSLYLKYGDFITAVFKWCFHQFNFLNVTLVTNHSSFSLVKSPSADLYR